MTITPLPRQYLFTCSFCPKQEHHDSGIFSEPPKGWMTAVINYNEVDDGKGFKSQGREQIICCPEHATRLKYITDTFK